MKKGHEVTVYTTDVFSPKSNERIRYRTRTIDGVRVHYFSNVAEFSEMYISPAIVPAFRRNLNDFDLVHLHEHRSFQNIAFLMGNTRKIQYVLQTHGIKQSEKAGTEGKPFHVATRRGYDQVFGKRLICGASKIIALTPSEKALLRASGAEEQRIAVIPNGVSPEDFARTGRNFGKDAFKERFGLSGRKVVMFVGRINKTKGLETLVKAFSLLQTKHGDIKLVIVGPDDGYLLVLKDLVSHLGINDKVVFTGLVGHEQTPNAYAAADVVVYPGIYEGFPVVPLEAGIMGKPLVVSDDPGMDYVRDGGFGLTFRYGNENELKEALDRVLRDQRLARRLGKIGRKCILEKYTWDKVAGKIEELYLEISSRG